MRLVELKKQRESLKKPQIKDSKMIHDEPSTIDELPMHELLGADPEPRRLGKRPRLDCSTDISTEVRQDSRFSGNFVCFLKSSCTAASEVSYARTYNGCCYSEYSTLIIIGFCMAR
jgi:hypothetical protein